eukprot:8630532-Karenia_brevis.AAC.1
MSSNLADPLPQQGAGALQNCSGRSQKIGNLLVLEVFPPPCMIVPPPSKRKVQSGTRIPSRQAEA